MAKAPFRAIIKPAGLGATTYTVPAGKFAVCNAFLLVDAFGSAGGYTSGSGPFLRLNGVDMTMLTLRLGRSVSRHGPFVFNAGDVIANVTPATQVPKDIPFAFMGFLYDTSVRKVPVNQRMNTGSSSYTVPAGKHILANFFPQVAPIFVKINSDVVLSFGTGGLPADYSSDFASGPITAAAGDVISTELVITGNPATYGLLNGFLYNN